MRALVLPASLALAGGLVAGLLVATRRLRGGASAPSWTFAEADVLSNLFHLPVRAW